MLNRFRAFWTGLITPIARLLLRWKVSPDAVTVVGTLGVAAGALIFFPRGQLLVGVLVITAFVFSDLLDGTMARMSGQSSAWGAFLDSTLDRIGDAAIFGGLAMYYVGPGDSEPLAALAIYCLVMGAVTSYARAKAESLGMKAAGRSRRAGRPPGRDPGDDRTRRHLPPPRPHRAHARGPGPREHRHRGAADLDGPLAGDRGAPMTSTRDRLQTAGYSAAWRLTGLLPERWARRGFERAGARVARRGRPRRRAAARQSRARGARGGLRGAGPAHRGGDEVLPALLVRGVPAAVLADRRPRRAHRHRQRGPAARCGRRRAAA